MTTVVVEYFPFSSVVYLTTVTVRSWVTFSTHREPREVSNNVKLYRSQVKKGYSKKRNVSSLISSRKETYDHLVKDFCSNESSSLQWTIRSMSIYENTLRTKDVLRLFLISYWYTWMKLKLVVLTLSLTTELLYITQSSSYFK